MIVVQVQAPNLGRIWDAVKVRPLSARSLNNRRDVPLPVEAPYGGENGSRGDAGWSERSFPARYSSREYGTCVFLILPFLQFSLRFSHSSLRVGRLISEGPRGE